MSLEKRRNLLVQLLNDPDESVRHAAAEALERLESCQELNQILENLRSDKRGLKVKAVFALEKMNRPEAFPPLIELLKDPDPDIRSSAVQVLGAKAHPKSLNSLVRHLKDPAPAVRVHTAEALGKFKDARLVPYLSAVLTDEDEQLVISAIRSLAEINVAEAVGPIANLAKDRRAVVRRVAAEALGRLPL